MTRRPDVWTRYANSTAARWKSPKGNVPSPVFLSVNWLERGMLRPGEMLFNPRGQQAKVRADGTLVADDISAARSIRSVLPWTAAPSCNGWTYWSFKRDGKIVPIELLRQQIRSEMS